MFSAPISAVAHAHTAFFRDAAPRETSASRFSMPPRDAPGDAHADQAARSLMAPRVEG
jgi:hypothetical protein